VVLIDDQLHAIDTASTNGTRAADDEHHFHIAPLKDGQVLSLANGVARLRWYGA
jgi:hypothetical protein